MVLVNFSQAGYSLLELLLTISLGIILVAGSTLTLSTLHSTSEEKTAEEILLVLKQASLCAINSQRTVVVTLENSTITSSCKNRTTALPKPYNYLTHFGGNEGAIAFYPTGFTSAGTISITGETGLCTISQTISGARRLRCSNAS